MNDGSQDATTPICDELAEQYPEVRAIHHVENRGYGAALKSGILAARHDFIFFTDSDGQFDLEELEHLIEWASHYEIVTGYRAKRQDPPHRLINAWGWKMLVRMVLGVKVRDIDCAFKIFQRSVFDRVQIRSVGAMVNTEILAQANSFRDAHSRSEGEPLPAPQPGSRQAQTCGSSRKPLRSSSASGASSAT